MISSILFAVEATVPATLSWSPTVGIIISICTGLSVLLAPRVIEYPLVGPKFPGPLALSIPAFVGATCFGHIIGVAIVLGLANTGTI